MRQRWTTASFYMSESGLLRLPEIPELQQWRGRRSFALAPPRANAIANTLQQLSIFIPTDVTLADLVVGWRTLSHASQQGEEPATAQRRVTCGELATMAAQLTTEQGNIAQAIKTWRIWRDAFQKSDDPRQAAMSRTFARELTELQATKH